MPDVFLPCLKKDDDDDDISRVSTLYGLGGGGGSYAFGNRKQCFFLNSILKTQKINAITQVSQGILSPIVVHFGINFYE